MKGRQSLEPAVHRILAALIVASLLLGACGPAAPGANELENPTDPSGEAPLAAQPTGPFRAVATSAISVDLSWDPVDGATGYRIENQFGESEWFALAELPGDQLAYEDFPAPSNMELNYRLTALEAGQEGRMLDTSVSTPEVVPSPYSVVATLEEPDYSDIGLDIPGFDPETFDPETFDPSTMDFSALDPENLDFSSIGPEPVSAMGRIGPEGGSVSVTDRNGVIYTLEVPPDGLAFPVLFLLTPIAEIEGYPFAEGWRAAVDIQPAGIYFDIPATVTFKIPVDESSEAQGDPEIVDVGFAFDLGGGEFHLVPIEERGVSEAQMTSPTRKLASPAQTIFRIDGTSLRRTSSAGAGSASRTGARKFTRENPPTRPSDRADSGSAAEDLDEKDDAGRAERAAERIREALGEGGPPQFVDILFADFAAFYGSGLYKQLAQEDKDRLWRHAVAVALIHLQNPEKECPSEEAAALQELVRRLMRPRSDFDRELAKRFLADNTQHRKDVLEAHAAVRSCRVELVVYSLASISDEQCKAEFSVMAEVPLTWHFDGEPFLQGVDQLKYEEVKVGQGFRPQKAVCEEYSFDNLDRSAVVVSYLHPIFSGSRHTDWSMMKRGTGGLSGHGEVRKVVRVYLQTDDNPPTRHSGQGSSTQGGYSDPWGGIISLIGIQTEIWPGASNWKISRGSGESILAEWDLGRSALGSGQGWKAEHRTILTIVTAEWPRVISTPVTKG